MSKEKEIRKIIMLNSDKKITIEMLDEQNKQENFKISELMTKDESKSNIEMVKSIINSELPMLQPDSWLYELLVYSLIEKVTTVQNLKNVVSCIKGNNGKSVDDISFKNGEVFIKCSI